MTPVAIGDIQRTQGTLKTVYNAKKTVRGSSPVSTFTIGKGILKNDQCICHYFWNMQGLSVPIACVGSSDPVRVLRLYTTNTLDIFLKHLLLRHMYNLPLPVLLCYAQALLSETSYCVWVCLPSLCTVLCGALYTACVDASRTVFWDCSIPLLAGESFDTCSKAAKLILADTQVFKPS